ncbi:hypothetical protein AAP_02142 [Ascosphaera apis ARSEF 7405]|uniref:Uncharacterized protein n=1 Tax=Ascosphaera apis ARSEF 7405 TaxID=392613 RepID=A0A168AKT2_9EURO|nr:hypothetical protein AAP_02142 [Ascosphaera apis ARSEF 7405]
MTMNIIAAIVVLLAGHTLAARSDKCTPSDDPGTCNMNYVFKHDIDKGNIESWVALHDHKCEFIGQYNKIVLYEPLKSLLPHMLTFSSTGKQKNASDVEFWYFTDHYKGGFKDCVETDVGIYSCVRQFDCHWDVTEDLL